MTPSMLSIYMTNAAMLIYLFAAVFYVLYFINKKQWAYIVSPIVAGVALVCHAVALIDRWIQGGFYRPPWTNLYESLIYFSFGLALISFVVELRFKVRYLGAFVYLMVFSALGLAFLVPVKEITPLVPSLQSWWILSHSCLAAFAYSGFLVASVLAFLYLVKVGMSERALGASLGFVLMGVLLMVGGSEVFLQNKYLMTEMVNFNGAWVKNPIPGSDPVKFFMLEISHMALLFQIGAALSFVASLVYIFIEIKIARLVLSVSYAVYTVLIGYMTWIIYSYQSITMASNPYSYTLLVLFLFVVGFCLAYIYRGEKISLHLPEATKLDQISYKVTLFAFPFMTLILITGAIWAHEAWGRFWGWDPKETTALVTWLIYAAYLHSRMTPGWSGKRAAVISIIGFFSVIFTYLGTNLVLSGLHSYGSK